MYFDADAHIIQLCALDSHAPSSLCSFIPAAMFRVQQESVCAVLPSKPSGKGELLELSTLDRMQKRDPMPYLQRVAFFSCSDSHRSCNNDKDYQSKVETLKSSLSQVLVAFYPFAGRLVVREDTSQPAICCSDAGVEFCEAYIDADMEEASEVEACHPLLRELIRRGSYETTALEDHPPLFSIQITRFRCGGLCIAWSFDHMIGDGNSVWHFMSSWAEVCAGHKISRLPYHCRDFEKSHAQLKPLAAELGTVAAPYSYQFKDMSVGAMARSFKFTASHIQKLKLMASVGKHSFSSYEVLAAHLWRQITRAREIPDKKRKIGYGIACDIRYRLSPALPDTFCGNAILMPTAEAAVGELEAEGVACGASLIHDAITSFSIDDILSSICKYRRNAGSNPLGLGLDEGVHVWHGGSLRFPLYDIDLGWGKAMSVKNVRCLWDGFCYLDPAPPQNSRPSAEATVCLKPEVMERFARYAYDGL